MGAAAVCAAGAADQSDGGDGARWGGGTHRNARATRYRGGAQGRVARGRSRLQPRPAWRGAHGRPARRSGGGGGWRWHCRCQARRAATGSAGATSLGRARRACGGQGGCGGGASAARVANRGGGGRPMPLWRGLGGRGGEGRGSGASQVLCVALATPSPATGPVGRGLKRVGWGVAAGACRPRSAARCSDGGWWDLGGHRLCGSGLPERGETGRSERFRWVGCVTCWGVGRCPWPWHATGPVCCWCSDVDARGKRYA